VVEGSDPPPLAALLCGKVPRDGKAPTPDAWRAAKNLACSPVSVHQWRLPARAPPGGARGARGGRLDDGRLALTLKAALTDGIRQLVFELLELPEELTALIPRRRINLVLDHGVPAQHSGWRARVVT